MIIKFKKLDLNAKIPTKAHLADAGFDLTATSLVNTREIATYGTGIAVQIPKGFVGLLFPRSSIYKKSLRLANSVGVIDSGYQGEIMFKFDKTKSDPLYNIGDRVGQLVILPIPEVTFKEVTEFQGSDRSTGGFGSTGT